MLSARKISTWLQVTVCVQCPPYATVLWFLMQIGEFFSPSPLFLGRVFRKFPKLVVGNLLLRDFWFWTDVIFFSKCLTISSGIFENIPFMSHSIPGNGSYVSHAMVQIVWKQKIIKDLWTSFTLCAETIESLVDSFRRVSTVLAATTAQEIVVSISLSVC